MAPKQGPTSHGVNADNLYYVKLKELYARPPHIVQIRETGRASPGDGSELQYSSSLRRAKAEELR